ncbi:MAG: hypothetical protein WC277_08765 [Bacilli bacterium]|jgi:hypothetical protein
MELTAKQERILWGAWTLAGLACVLGTLHRYFVDGVAEVPLGLIYPGFVNDISVIIIVPVYTALAVWGGVLFTQDVLDVVARWREERA